jgi:hypothetical protein
MPLWMTLLTFCEAFTLPLLGSVALVTSKLTAGSSAEAAQRWFVGVLVAVTLITCRTVITSDSCWLLHTATLSMMVVGALLLPDRQTLQERRVSQATRMSV